MSKKDAHSKHNSLSKYPYKALALHTVCSSLYSGMNSQLETISGIVWLWGDIANKQWQKLFFFLFLKFPWNPYDINDSAMQQRWNFYIYWNSGIIPRWWEELNPSFSKPFKISSRHFWGFFDLGPVHCWCWATKKKPSLQTYSGQLTGGLFFQLKVNWGQFSLLINCQS